MQANQLRARLSRVVEHRKQSVTHHKVKCKASEAHELEAEENEGKYYWFNTVTNYPPVIPFAVNDSAPGRLKDTATNLKNGQGFTVNIISKAFVKNANATAIDAPRNFDECTFITRYMR
ncbi:uncharacterized protein HD556DRAFT_1540341 [Suillus plorans]|uniref:Uncharacterized protein n=1 Tax=Suillus plorans TaxID=116603 RepID=A0A9P7A980_9AGAM|nr:uncharacterized protein HD556DRAFT_1540341 [Suillus plorans]KAG1784763.1 hypothetical protein HD556DRAFT_1540341 [Suillus plorans]